MQNFYSLEPIKKLDCEYNIIYGERSNGKSYAVKEECLKSAYEYNEQFALIRRWQMETKTVLTEYYFQDMNIAELTNHEYNCIQVYRGNVYFATASDNEVVRGKQCGVVMYLSGGVHFKGVALPNIHNVIFEEFITNEGYLDNEVTRFVQLISTIARRRRVHVYMIGNTVSRFCPYVREWGLSKLHLQKQGTIDVYEHHTDQEDEHGRPVVVRIAVEYCENSGKNSKMFFGNAGKMVTGGAWESDVQPKLIGDYKEYRVIVSYLLEAENICYVLQVLEHKVKRVLTLYAYPYTTPIYKDNYPEKFAVIITDRYTLEPRAISSLTNDYPCSIIISRLASAGKLCFSDNLTGTEVKDILKRKGVKYE